jgi:hypothetical protein
MQLGANFYRNSSCCSSPVSYLKKVKTVLLKRFKCSFSWICRVLLGVNVLFYTARTPVEITPCTPKEKHWKYTLEDRFLNVTKVRVVLASINFMSDVIILFNIEPTYVTLQEDRHCVHIRCQSIVRSLIPISRE